MHRFTTVWVRWMCVHVCHNIHSPFCFDRLKIGATVHTIFILFLFFVEMEMQKKNLFGIFTFAHVLTIKMQYKGKIKCDIIDFTAQQFSSEFLRTFSAPVECKCQNIQNSYGHVFHFSFEKYDSHDD